MHRYRAMFSKELLYNSDIINLNLKEGIVGVCVKNVIVIKIE